jgi:hypothetical protein
MVHAFVDETKSSGYLVAAAMLMPSAGFLLPNVRRLHFNKERDCRRAQIVDAIAKLPVEVVLYDGSAHRGRRDQRAACLTSLVGDLAKRDARMLVIEPDYTALEADLRLLYHEVRAAGCAETLHYRHLRAHEEALLALPDAVAWCWARGGIWKKRVRPLVSTVKVA